MIYTNGTDRKVYLDVPIVPIDGTLEVTVCKDSTQVFEVQQVVAENDGRLSFVMPFSLVQSDNTYDVHWRFQYLENAQTYEYDSWTTEDIVTPILPLRDIKSILDDEDVTDEEVYNIERAVRNIIQSHTGQFFGRYVGVLKVTGVGDSNLRLPRRLISMNSINNNANWQNNLSIRGGGWYLKTITYGVPSIRADYYGWHEIPSTSSAPIVAPYSKTMQPFVEDVEYSIDGVWGWNTIPQKVSEAARLLVNDYACGDSLYRDRFIRSVSTADWTLNFHDGAFRNTGNVRADQLLSEYVLRRGWTVI
jgi:hypothetical protein